MKPTEPKATAKKQRKASPRPEARNPGSNGARVPTPADLDELLEWIATGEEDATARSFRAGCLRFGLRRTEAYKAMAEDAWRDKYVRAHELRSEEIAEGMFATAAEAKRGDIDPKAAHVDVDVRKFVAAKMAPKRFGAKSEVDVTSAGEKLPAATVFVVGRDMVDRVVSESDDGGDSG